MMVNVGIFLLGAFIGGMLTYIFVDWNNDEWGGWA